MENILNVVSIFGHKIDWELDTALFWLFIVQAALVVFLVIVFAVLLHRVGKNNSTVIVQTTAEKADKNVPNEEEQKLAEDSHVVDETPVMTEDAVQEDAKPEEEGPATEEENEIDAIEETKADLEEQPDDEQTDLEEQPEDVQTDIVEQASDAEAQQLEPQCEEEQPEQTFFADDTEPQEETAQELCFQAASDLQQEEQEDESFVTIESVDEEFLDDEGATEEGVLRYNKSFTARLILSDDNVKTWYTRLKNELLSYKKVKSRTSWKHETFRLGRNIVATLAYRGRTLCIYLPLATADYAESKYKVEDVSDQVTYADTPCMYRLKNQKRFRYAEELFAAVMEKMGGVRIDRAWEDYYLPCESIDELVEKGLVRCVVKSSADEAVFLHNASQKQPSVASADADVTSAAEHPETDVEIEEEQIAAGKLSSDEPADKPIEDQSEEPTAVDIEREYEDDPSSKQDEVDITEDEGANANDEDVEEIAADDIGTDAAQDAEDLDLYASDAEDITDDELDDDAEPVQSGEEQFASQDEMLSNSPAPQIRWNGKNRKKHRSHR